MPANLYPNGTWLGWSAAEDGWGDKVNSNFKLSEQTSIGGGLGGASFNVSVPVSGTSGQVVVATDGKVHVWNGVSAAWDVYTPKAGWKFFDTNDAILYCHNGGSGLSGWTNLNNALGTALSLTASQVQTAMLSSVPSFYATAGQTIAGTATTLAVTPDGLNQWFNNILTTLFAFATTTEVGVGTDATKYVNPASLVGQWYVNSQSGAPSGVPTNANRVFYKDTTANKVYMYDYQSAAWLPLSQDSTGLGSKATGTPLGATDGWEHFHNSNTSDTTSKIAARALGVYDSGLSVWFGIGGVYRDGTVQTLPASGGTINLIAPYAQEQMVYINGTGAGFATTVNAIAAPNFIGQKIRVLFDDSSSNFVQIRSGGNLKLKGNSTCFLGGISEISFVCDNTNQWVELERKEPIVGASVFTTTIAPGSNGVFYTNTSNSIVLPGTANDRFEVTAYGAFSNNGTSPQYTKIEVGIFSANGANSAVRPAAPNDVYSRGNSQEYSAVVDDSGSTGVAHVLPIKPGVFAGGQTLYLVHYAFGSAITNARMYGEISYKKI